MFEPTPGQGPVVPPSPLENAQVRTDKAIFSSGWLFTPSVEEKGYSQDVERLGKMTRQEWHLWLDDLEKHGIKPDELEVARQLYFMDAETKLARDLRDSVRPENILDPERKIAVGFALPSDVTYTPFRRGEGELHIARPFQRDKIITVYANIGDLEHAWEESSAKGQPFNPFSVASYQDDVEEKGEKVEIIEDTRGLIITRFNQTNRNRAIGEAIVLRHNVRDQINRVVAERKERLKKLADDWEWSDVPAGEEPRTYVEQLQEERQPVDFKNPDSLIKRAVAWPFGKAKRITSPAYKTTEKIKQSDLLKAMQEKVMQGVFQAKSWTTELESSIDDWWSKEIKGGSKDLLTGYGGWIAQGKMGERFRRILESRHLGIQTFRESLYTGCVIELEDAVSNKEPERKKEADDYAVVFYQGVPVKIPLYKKDNITGKVHTDVDEINKRMTAILRGESPLKKLLEGVNLPPGSDPFQAMSVILANLNNVPLSQREKYISGLFPTNIKGNNKINNQNTELRKFVKDIVKMVEGTRFSLSIDGDPYTAQQIGLFNAGLCQQTIQLHIDESRLFSHKEMPTIYTYNPHWEFDVNTSLAFTNNLMRSLVKYMDQYVPLPEGKEGTDFEMHQQEHWLLLSGWWGGFTTQQKRLFLDDLDRFARSTFDLTQLTAAAARLDRELFSELLAKDDKLRQQNGELSDAYQLDLTSKSIVGMNSVPIDLLDEWAEKIGKIIREKSTPKVVSPFNLSVIANSLVRAGEGETAAVLTPVIRDDPEKRLGVGIHGVNYQFQAQFADMQSFFSDDDNELNFSRQMQTLGVNNLSIINSLEADEVQIVISAITKTIVDKLNSYNGLMGKTMLSEIAEIRREVEKARRGTSAVMVLSAISGKEETRTLLQLAAKAILAGDESDLVSDSGQLSYIPLGIKETAGMVTDNKTGEKIWDLQGFTGARSSAASMKEVMAVVELDPKKARLTLRIPADKYKKDPEAAIRIVREQKQVLALFQLAGLNEAEIESLVSEYALECVLKAGREKSLEEIRSYSIISFLYEKLLPDESMQRVEILEPRIK